MIVKDAFLPKRFIKNFSIVGLWTLISRVLGFVRDILIATFLGSGPIAEAFLVAFTLPNMFRRLFAEGALNTAFIPIVSKKISKKTNPEEFASDAISVLITALLILTAVAEIFMPILVFGTASGLSSDARFDLSVKFGRVMFPYIFLISLSAFLGGILNALNRYSVSAAAPLLLNVLFIVSLLIAYIYEFDFGWAMTICVPIAGMSQLILMILFLKKENFRLKIRIPRLTPEIRRLVKIAIPAALAGGVIQINLVVGRQVASYFEGAIAWLNYADRIYQLPLGVVGIGISVVLLPGLSIKASNTLTSESNNIINRSIEFALLFTLPATCALIIIPYPIISTLFERGAFTTIDTINTSKALLVYAIGLPAFVFHKIFSTIYFSKGDTRSPFRYAVVGMIANLLLSIGLSGPIGYLAPALGTTLSGWLVAIMLWNNLYTLNFSFDNKFRKVILKLSLACLVLSIFLAFARNYLLHFLEELTTRSLSLTIIICSSITLYFLVCQILGLKKLFLKVSSSKNK